MSRCAHIAIIGRPNVGKSTLVNQLAGYRISAIANRPQTTRTPIRAILTEDDYQFIFVDTPGLHQQNDSLLNKSINAAVGASMEEVDIIVMLVEAGIWSEKDQYVLDRAKALAKPIILVVNKVDRVQEKVRLLAFAEQMMQKGAFKELIPINALKGQNTKSLKKVLLDLAPESEWLYPEDQITDRSVKFIASEFIREQAMVLLNQELPYSVAVDIERFEETESLVRIHAVIWVSKPAHKGIVLGKQGQMLKRIGTGARHTLEDFFQTKVFLQNWVKVRENWQNDERYLAELGLDLNQYKS